MNTTKKKSQAIGCLLEKTETRYVVQQYKKYLAKQKKAKIKKEASVHTLRHSFATHLLENGCDLFTIQTLLGHASIHSTKIYLHIENTAKRKILNPLDRIYEVYHED